MAIDSITGRLQSTIAAKTGPKNNIENNAAPAANISGDSVNITDNAAQVSKALESASTSPVVDSRRVDEIKQALASGSYNIDAHKIAQKMTEFDSLFSQNST